MITQTSVYLMIVGAMIAASDDLAFNWFGYVFLMINNLCTAAQSVVIKQKLINKVRESRCTADSLEIEWFSARISIKMDFCSTIHSSCSFQR